MPVAAPAAGISSGSVVVIGALAGIALNSATEGSYADVKLNGVFELPKAAEAIEQGTELFYDASAGLVTASETDATADADGAAVNIKIGHAFAAAAVNDATIEVKLLG